MIDIRELDGDRLLDSEETGDKYDCDPGAIAGS
jgi:hypothetical protein